MRLEKNGNKVMRKVKGIWVAVALMGVTALGVAVTEAATVSDTYGAAIAYVLTSDASTSFEGKAELAKKVADETVKAFEGVTLSWSPNTLDQVKAEIARQKELGLDAYVIQWGDTLSILAEIVGKDVDSLAAANGIVDKDLILVGDLLVNILESGYNVDIVPVAKPVESKPVEEAETESKQETPAKPVESKPVTKPEVPEVPDEENPEVPGKPETPVTPEVPGEENPEVPGKPETPVTPEVPGEEKPEVPGKPETPEIPEVPETPVTPERPEGDTVIKERTWLDKISEIVSTEGIFDGYDREEIIEGEVLTETEVREWEAELEEEGEWVSEITTETVLETRIELVPETRIELVPHISYEQVEQEIVVGYEEDGQPITEIEIIEVEVVEMVEEEITEMVEKEVQVEVENFVYIPGPMQHFHVLLNNVRETFAKHFIYDSTLDEGVEVVEQEGIDKVISEQILTVTQDGVVVDVQEGIMPGGELTPQITRIGTKRHIGDKVTINEQKVQEFAVIERATGDLYTDESEVLQEGVNGVHTVVKEQVIGVDGSVQSEVITSENKVDTVDQIVLVGTKPIHTTGTVVEREEQEVEVKTVYVNSEEEYTKVIEEGRPGILEHTYTVNYEKGVQVSTVLAGTNVISEGTTQVIEVGLGNIENSTRTEVEGINFNTVTKESNQLAKGERKVVQAGQKGETTIVFNETYVDGVLTSSSEVSRTVTKEAVDEVVEVGTGIETSKERSVDTPIAYTTKVVKDDTLYIGDTVIQQQGKDGYVRETFKAIM